MSERTIDILVKCPHCGGKRMVRGSKWKYSAVNMDDGTYCGERPCRKCAKALTLATTKRTAPPTKQFFDFWDHDPWESIRCEAVTANQLFDGWA